MKLLFLSSLRTCDRCRGRKRFYFSWNLSRNESLKKFQETDHVTRCNACWNLFRSAVAHKFQPKVSTCDSGFSLYILFSLCRSCVAPKGICFLSFHKLCEYMHENKRKAPQGNITWPKLGKQNIQAKEVCFGRLVEHQSFGFLSNGVINSGTLLSQPFKIARSFCKLATPGIEIWYGKGNRTKSN